MSYALSPEEPTIRARLNPMFMAMFMALPMIWIIGLPLSVTQDGFVIDGVFVFEMLLFELPVVLLVYNFVWHYRLEMTSNDLTMHRLFWANGNSVRLEDLQIVDAREGAFGWWLVFEWEGGRIRFSPRSPKGNLWPPVLLARMLRRVERRGVKVTPAAWSRLGRSSEEGKPGLVRWIVPLACGAGLPVILGPALLRMTFGDSISEALGIAVLVVSGLVLGIVLYLNDNHYGDLSEVAEESWQEERAA